MSDELMKKLDDVLDGVTKAQEVADRNEKRLDTLDKEQIERINEDVTKNIEEMNEIKTKQDAIEESVKSIETAAARPSNLKADPNVCSEAKAEFLRYFRKAGHSISEKVQEEIAENIARKSLLGGTDAQIEMLKKDMVVGSNPDGGYWVRPEFATFMIDRSFETSPMRQIASVQTINSESLQIIINDQTAAANWVGEVDTRATTATPQIGELTIHAHELEAFPLVSQKMLDDAGFDIESWLQEQVSSEFTRKENTAFVVGTSAKQPKGFLTYDPWAAAGVYERNKIEQIDSGTSGNFDADNLIELQNALIETYQPDGTWVMKRATFGVVMTLKASTSGEYLLNPSVIAQGAPQILLGKPVTFFDDMPAIAADALAVAYGSFKKGYTIVDRIGIRILRDPLTNKPFIGFYTTKRTGGDVTNYESIKILKLAV